LITNSNLWALDRGQPMAAFKLAGGLQKTVRPNNP
jgi:hypothetical protein